ncbi:efflux transporter outer membrane subunit [Salmonella enterica]|nr:efflux transporter outer membrane subunit [Salmonella enterica]
MKEKIILLIGVLALSACSLAPTLNKPSVDSLVQSSPTDSETTEVSPTHLAWRELFPDPRLQELVSAALNSNKDLKLATLNVAAAREQYGIQRSFRWPSVEAVAGASRQRAQDEVGKNSISNEYRAELSTSSFEIDLFGYARSMSESAFYRYLATEQGQKSAQIALIGAVADAYHAQLIAQEQLSLARQTLTDWQLSLELARRLKAADQSSGLDVAQAEGQVATAEADLQARTRALSEANNAMRFLIGRSALPENLSPEPILETFPKQTLPANLPSDLILNRPDVMQAEHNLRSANADIGAARAAFFPRLSLTASAGYSSSEMKNLFDNQNQVWSFSPQINLPIFNAGKLRAELRLAEIRKSSAIVEYERVIQNAFKEIADGLSGLETFGRQIDAQQRVVASAMKRAELSLLRYNAGLDGRLELLDAQRQLYADRQILIDLRGAELANYVALYKALGGSVPASLNPGAGK